MASASNSSVKPEPARAHGTAICLTPQSGQVMRGVRACRNAWCWKKSRCRHVLHGGVVHRAVGLAALRAREAAAAREVDLDVEASRLGIEVGTP